MPLEFRPPLAALAACLLVFSLTLGLVQADHMQGTVSAPVPAPVQISPTNGGTTSDSTPTFTWENIRPADDYQIQVDDSSAFSSPEIDVSVAQKQYTPSTALPDGQYYWRLRMTRTGVSSDWSEVSSFSVSTGAEPVWTTSLLQAAVTISDPATRATIPTTTKKDTWLIEGTAQKPRATIYIYRGSSDTIPSTTTASTTAAAGGGYPFSLIVTLSEGTNAIYFKEVDNAGNSSGLILYGTYTVDKTAPVITISAPADLASTDVEQVTVSGTITDAVAYDQLTVIIDYSTANGQKQIYLNSNGSFSTSVPLVVGTNVVNVLARDSVNITALTGNQAVKTIAVTRTVSPTTQAQTSSTIPVMVVSVENLKISLQQQTTGLGISIETSQLQTIDSAFAGGNIGACVTIKQETGATDVSTQYCASDVQVTVATTVGSKIEATVSSTAENGKTVVLNVDSQTLSIQAGAISVLYDNQEIGLASDYADVLDPTNESVPEYLILIGGSGAQVLVSVPHFSTHTITIMPTVPTAQMPPIYLAIIAAMILVAVVVVIIWRYLSLGAKKLKMTAPLPPPPPPAQL